MVPLTTLHKLYNYNYWARDRQLEACAALTTRQFLQPMVSSFPSIRDTLAHMVDTEAYYLHRWRGRSRQQIIAEMGFARGEERSKLWPGQFHCLADIEFRWREIELAVREYLATLNETDLSRLLSYVDSAGRTWTYPLWLLLLHVVNHQTYHRGQVTVLLRQLGVNAAQIDLLVGSDVVFGAH